MENRVLTTYTNKFALGNSFLNEDSLINFYDYTIVWFPFGLITIVNYFLFKTFLKNIKN